MQVLLAFFLVVVLGLTPTFVLGCYVDGADIKIALIVYLVAVNVVAFFVFILDKGIASGYLDCGGDRWRVAEGCLLSLMFFGGAFGAWLGMGICRHKVSKRSFLWRGLVLTIFSLTWLYLWLILTAKDNLSICYKH